MASEYPYVLVLNKVPVLFDKIGTVGKPVKADTKWLKQIGMTSSNDSRFLGVLAHLGFIDGSKTPTQRWQDYRGPSKARVLASALREAYSDLFHTYPEANNASNQDIANFIKSNTSLGSDTVNRAVATFKTLVDLADFSGSEDDSPKEEVREGEKGDSVGGPAKGERPTKKHNHDIVINLNLQLTLPETTDPNVYEVLFLALKKHVLSGSQEA
jgi:hypothetical protein